MKVYHQINVGLATTTLLLTSQLFHQVSSLIELDPASDGYPIDIIQRERLLRQFVQFTLAYKQLCFPDAWAKLDTKHQLGPRDVHSFQRVFNQLFTLQNLTHSYLFDVEQAVRTSRIIDQLHRNSINSTATLNGVLRSFVQTSDHLQIFQSLDYANIRQHTVLSILVCQGHRVLGYVNRYGTDLSTNSPCFTIQNESLIIGMDHTSSVIGVGNWQFRWLIDQCETISSNDFVAVPIKLIIKPSGKEESLRFLFEFDLRNYTLDQCAVDAHRCSSSTRCVYRQYSDWPFAMDNYICQCTQSFYLDNSENGYRASFIHSELEKSDAPDGLRQFHCLPCGTGCAQCGGNQTCRIQTEPSMLRFIPLAIQSFCCTTCVFLGIAVFRLRRSRVIRAANWLLMEILLFGAILLYLIVVVMYFPTNDITCLILPWLRELGFSVMYGVLIVKIYRVLSGFQSRKAHRVHIRDKDILKFLGIFIVTTFTYLVAWTAVHLDYVSSSPWTRNQLTEPPVSVVQPGKVLVSEREYGRLNQSTLTDINATSLSIKVMTFDVCPSLSWDIVIELVEFIILIITLHYCRLVRTAPSEFNETMYISIALIVELTVSVIFNIVRHTIWYNTSPDCMFLMYFARSHITITVNLALIFGPKAWFIYRPTGAPGSANRPRLAAPSTYTVDPNLAPAGKLNMALNGDLDIVDVSLAEMDPEVIRRELKRLYTQIELYKTKAMRKDNPHISKRRGGRKQRRFSLQPFHKRHHGQSIAGAVQLLGSSDSGYSWSECRGSRGSQCPKHGAHSNLCQSVSAGAGRPVQSGIVHDEEVSRVSEESTNSMEDVSPPANVQEHSIVCATVSSPAAAKTQKSSTGVATKQRSSKTHPHSPNIRID